MSFCTDIEEYLSTKYKGRLIAVEYISGDSSKKAIGILGTIAPNSLELISNDDTCPYIRIKVISSNNQMIEECAKEMIIMMNNIIAVEIDPYCGYSFCREPEVEESTTIEEKFIKPSVEGKFIRPFVEEEKFTKPLSGGILEYHGTGKVGFIEEEEESWEEE